MQTSRAKRSTKAREQLEDSRLLFKKREQNAQTFFWYYKKIFEINSRLQIHQRATASTRTTTTKNENNYDDDDDKAIHSS
jgi:hypothetical protein